MAKNCSMTVALAVERPARLAVRTNALITVLDEDVSFDGTLANVSDGGAQLRLDRSVPLSSLVKIECADFFLLGEVVSCDTDRGDWVVGIHVEHGLYGLKALSEAIRRSWIEQD